MLKNLVKREAEGSYLGFWVPKHINCDTCILGWSDQAILILPRCQ